MDSERPRIAIIGAGIAGLTLSHALNVLGGENTPHIDIYEAASQVTEIGAGINIWPRTWNIMKTLGLSETLLQFLPHAPDDIPRLVFEVRKADQPEGYHVYDLMSNGGTIRLHRKTLHRTLLARQPTGRVHLSKRFLSYEETDFEVKIHFADGTTATCDILIGADGIRSIVRRHFLQKQLSNATLTTPISQVEGQELGEPVWSGTYAYRGLVPVEKLEALFPGHRAITTPMMYSGKLKHIICYPLPADGAVNVVAVTTDLSKEGTIHPMPTFSSCDREEVLSLFDGWEPEVQSLLECIEKPLRWALMTLIPLERYARGRVALAGDAAHGMTPHQGAGAGQAFDDVYVLASLLTHPLSTTHTIPTISSIYNTIRRPEGNRVLALARRAGFVAEFVGPGFEDVVEGDTGVDKDLLREAFEGMIKEWDWVWNSAAEDDRRKAEGMLVDEVGKGGKLELELELGGSMVGQAPKPVACPVRQK